MLCSKLMLFTCGLALIGAKMSSAQVLYSEGFDSEESAKIGTDEDPFTLLAFTDYSEFDVGAESHAVPEAPNRIAGSAPTSGLLLQANVEDEENFGSSGGIVVIALEAVEGSPMVFSGDYRVSFDVFVSIDPIFETSHPGTTEVVLWAVGTEEGAERNLFATRKSADVTGTWGWLATDSDIGSSGDATIYVGSSLEEIIKETTNDPSELFLEAFPDATPFPGTPNGIWTTVQIDVRGSSVSVHFNGVPIFEVNDSPATEGLLSVGYEDPFNSLSGSPDFQWAILDNLVVTRLEPPSLAITTKTAIPEIDEEGKTATGELLVSNNREQELIVSEIKLTGQGAAAFLIDTPTPITVPAGGEVAVEVVFDPGGENGTYSAIAEFVSNDPDKPSILVALEATRAVAAQLLAHFKLDDPDGSTRPADASGNDVGASYQERDPILFEQPALAGSGSAVGFTAAQAPDSGNFILATPLHTPTISASMWIKPEEISGEHALINRDPAFTGQDSIYGLFIDPEGTLVFRSSGEAAVQTDPETIAEGETYHVVVTHLDTDGFGNDTATRTRLYVNGELVIEATDDDTFGFDRYPPDARTTALYIATKSAAGFGYTGAMDDVQLYSVELSEQQVAAMFANPGRTAVDAPSSAFEVTSVRVIPGTRHVSLTWNSTPGKSYTVQQASDLKAWEEAADGIPSGGEQTSYTDMDVSAELTNRYYRVVEE